MDMYNWVSLFCFTASLVTIIVVLGKALWEAHLDKKYEDYLIEEDAATRNDDPYDWKKDGL